MKGEIVCGGICFAEEEIAYFLEKARYDLAMQREIWQLLFELCAGELKKKSPEKQVFSLSQKILDIDQKDITYFIGKICNGFSRQDIPRILNCLAEEKKPAKIINGGIKTDNGRIFSAEEIETLINATELNPRIWKLLIEFFNREVYGTNKYKIAPDEKLLKIGTKIIMALKGYTENSAMELIRDGSPLKQSNIG